MIEEQATVLALESGAVWVEADRSKGCERCESGQGCGGGVLGRMVKRGKSRVRAINDIPNLGIGDEVVLGLDERLLVKGSLMTYMLPLITMIGAALLADLLIGAGDLGVAAFGGLGLGIGLFMLRFYSARLALKGAFQPRVLRRAAGRNSGCQTTSRAVD